MTNGARPGRVHRASNGVNHAPTHRAENVARAYTCSRAHARTHAHRAHSSYGMSARRLFPSVVVHPRVWAGSMVTREGKASTGGQFCRAQIKLNQVDWRASLTSLGLAISGSARWHRLMDKLAITDAVITIYFSILPSDIVIFPPGINFLSPTILYERNRRAENTDIHTLLTGPCIEVLRRLILFNELPV